MTRWVDAWTAAAILSLVATGACGDDGPNDETSSDSQSTVPDSSGPATTTAETGVDPSSGSDTSGPGPADSSGPGPATTSETGEPPACEQLLTQADCEAAGGCIWLPINECAIDCATATDEATCMELPFCAWDGSACGFGGVGET